ncbi:MAG: hypothetical protein NTW19_08225 [Planctomycetota bacterium]|nr:hypothetical protein [Planctomycetota bacterium]
MASTSPTAAFSFPGTSLPANQRALLLAIDDAALPLRLRTCLYLSKPTVRPEAVLKPSPVDSLAPDNLAAHFYGTVLQDNGIFRMWYYACHWGYNPDWPPRMMQQTTKPPGWASKDTPVGQGPLCYAESKDGITWTKPALGQVLFKGSKANNALALPHTIVSGAIVIKDPDDPDPARRYKMTYQFFPDQSDPIIEEYGTMTTVALAVSPDGIAWTVIGIPFKGTFVEPSSFIKHAGQYTIHYQTADDWGGYMAEGATRCGRTGVARVTHDFSKWPDVLAESFALPEPEDRTKRGANGDYDQVHLGVGAASFGNVCVGLYGLWHNADNNKGFGSISCDFGLLVSNDGVRFREPVKGHRFIRREESLVTPVPGRDFNTILCQANGIINVGDETRIYHGRWRNAGSWGVSELKHYSAEVALATLPRDRWGAIGLMPGQPEGTVWSAPITLPGSGVAALTLNAEGADSMRVEVSDEKFGLLPAFSGSNAGASKAAGGLDCAVAWPGSGSGAGTGAGLAALAGKTVRFRVTMKRGSVEPRLYAVNLAAG